MIGVDNFSCILRIFVRFRIACVLISYFFVVFFFIINFFVVCDGGGNLYRLVGFGFGAWEILAATSADLLGTLLLFNHFLGGQNDLLLCFSVL